MADDPTARFAALVARSEHDVPLDEALLLIAAHARAGLDLPAERARLDDLASGLREPTVDGLCAYLFGELGFAGDGLTYHDAQNSLLPAVLDRRRGIPITLAALAMEVGRRCGVGLDGVGMPGHFLVRSSLEPRRYFDVFAGGAELDAAGCRDLFTRLAPGARWDDAFLRRSAPPAILARVLANLAAAFRRAGDRRGLCWALDLRLLLPGATAAERRELGVLLGASGRFAEGATVLEASGEERDHAAAARLRSRLN